MLRSAFNRISNTKGFRYMSYALSGAAMTVAAVATYEMLTSAEILPEWTRPSLAGGIIGIYLLHILSFLHARHRPSADR
jgi:high-affinity nickel-transport protein